MSKKHESRLAMYHSVLKLASAHPEIGADIPSFKESLKALETITLSIDPIFRSWFAPQTGQTKVKNALRVGTIEAVFPIMAQLSSLAAATKDLELVEKTRYPISKLKKMREGQFVQFTALIEEEALAHAEELKAYGVDQVMLDHMTEHVDAFRKVSGMRGKNVALRSGQLRELGVLFAEGNEILSDHLDKQMELFRASHPHFYHEYSVARIVRTSVRHRIADPQVPPDGTSTATPMLESAAEEALNPPIPAVSGTPASTQA